MKNLTLILFYVALTGCSSTGKYEKSISSNYSQGSKKITQIEQYNKFVIFDINKDKSINIISVKNSFGKNEAISINKFNKSQKKSIRSCIQLLPKAICPHYINPNIFLKRKSRGVFDTLAGVITSPLSLAIDTLDVASGGKPNSLKNSFTNEVVDSDFVNKIGNIIDSILYNKYSHARSTNTLDAFLYNFSFPKIKKMEEARKAEIEEKRIEKIIGALRNEGSSSSFLEAYKLTSDKNDLKQAFKIASTVEDKRKAEMIILKDLPTANVFNISSVSSRSKSNLENLVEEEIPLLKNISEISMNTKTLTKQFKLSPKIPLNGDYLVKVDFILKKSWRMKSNMLKGFIGGLAKSIIQTDSKTYSATFKINKTNNYIDSQKIEFEISGVSTSTLGVTMSSEIVGLDISTFVKDVILINNL